MHIFCLIHLSSLTLFTNSSFTLVSPPALKSNLHPLRLCARHAGKVRMYTSSLASRMSSQELSIRWRIGHCKSLPTAQFNPDPAQAPQCPPRESWLRPAFRSAPFLLSSSGWSFEQGASLAALWLFLSFRATNVLKQHSIITWH